jgi:UDP-glucose 6-dehydrogenase
MNVTIIGTGYVGLTTGLALAHVGHAATCVDINERVVERLRAGEPTIFETGLQELLTAVRAIIQRTLEERIAGTGGPALETVALRPRGAG